CRVEQARVPRYPRGRVLVPRGRRVQRDQLRPMLRRDAPSMTPVTFPESNCYFGPPPELTDSQVGVIQAYQGPVTKGSVDGAHMTIVAWQPNPDELEAILRGTPIFLTFMGGLPP